MTTGSRLSETGSAIRMLIVGGLTYGLTAVGVKLLAREIGFMAAPFLYYLVMVAAAKLIGDAVYFIVSPGRRDWVRIDEYLLDDYVTFFRFGFPLAMVQAYALNTGYIPLTLLPFWLGPALPVAVFLINRWLVERSQDERRSKMGGPPLVTGPNGG